MGYNTTLLIINDGFDQLEKNPAEFVDGVARAMHRGGTVSVGNHGNVVQVMKTEHADIFRLYASQGNSMVELSPYSQETLRLVDRMPEHLLGLIHAARTRLDGLEKRIKEQT